jgi:DNA-binding MarR family transcriptional regulator
VTRLELNDVIHQPARLRIMASLSALGGDERMDFRTLRDVLELTDGNLGAHLVKLEDAGYLTVEKTFLGKKPRTLLRLTTAGRAAFETHVAALKALLG